ncbi:CPXCG motif-containing cysteine-rich protein [Alloalcanivorax gelatiniphagus]|uniref:CPXCG motif-containing cysteine-rich protein n=1 Tax=Alloalcanivorax gelatiniphagus TaxID=1194167 RepID=A0ABY2XQE7_9GAMM|nr:CPXCG motif-containing cysteine-rich protein [Alloalcanivorax gelatiniphagus]TMW14978.1 CPXCG motif-containing cysteine-rich protein [Alloalcanivorax gelatiniphagus]|tara:strand:+ start:13953 stop:14141 length:189 start_codon:yes stop_codon:yes gene_type:complete
MELIPVAVQCPHCWEHFEALVDPSQGEQEYVEDCHVCCQPLLFTVSWEDPETPVVSASPENP